MPSASEAEAWIAAYTAAAARAEAGGDSTRACFYLTHAFVHALEAGSPEVTPLNARLVAYGAETPL